MKKKYIKNQKTIDKVLKARKCKTLKELVKKFKKIKLVGDEKMFPERFYVVSMHKILLNPEDLKFIKKGTNRQVNLKAKRIKNAVSYCE